MCKIDRLVTKRISHNKDLNFITNNRKCLLYHQNKVNCILICLINPVLISKAI